MTEPWSFIATHVSLGSEEELKRVYGEEALVTRAGDYHLIHLDNPDPEEVQRRLAEFDPDDFYDDDCPLCRMMKGARTWLAGSSGSR